MVGADVHPAGVGGQVVDPVRDRLAQAVLGEVVRRGLARAGPGPPFAAGVLELPDQLLLLGVHADHRVAGVLVGPGLLVDVPELRVPVRVLLALDGLGVALQAEPLLVQQVTDRVRADLVALAGQLGRQRPGRLDRPPQRRHRIAPLIRLDQRQQRREQPRIQVGGPLAAPARAGGPGPAAPRPDSSSATPSDTVPSRIPAARATSPDPAMPQRAGLSAHQQPPLPLIQMREHRPELRRQRLPGFAHGVNITPVSEIPGAYGLFFFNL